MRERADVPSRTTAARRLAGALLAAGALGGSLGAAVPPAALAQQQDDGAARSVQRAAPPGFADPPAAMRPKMRWWWPQQSGLEGAQLDREVQAMAGAGFGGAEVSFIAGPRGFGDDAWRDQVKRALAEAGRNRVKLDLTMTPAWPVTSPRTTEALSQSELFPASARLAGGATFDAPVPIPQDLVGRPRLVAATAARLADDRGEVDPRSIALDPSTAVDLTARVRPDGTLRWSAPAGGEWVVFGFWQRSTGHALPHTNGFADAARRRATLPRSDAGTWFVVDHFSAAATDSALGFLDEVYDRSGLGDLLRRNGSDLFEDSLELQGDVLWTEALPQQFASRRGYALAKYLPALLIPGRSFHVTPLQPMPAPEYDFTGGIGRRVRHDYEETMTDLYVENHVARMDRWAKRRGMRLRSQVAYNIGGLRVTRSARSVAVPETETYEFGGENPYGTPRYRYALDGYRVTAAGAHQSGAPGVSAELGDVNLALWGQDPIDYKHLIDGAFAGGVTQPVIHGYAHQQPYTWPGWAPFIFVGISEGWNTNYPQWRDWAPLTGYMGRARTVLEAGKPSLDVAIYHDQPTDILHDQREVFADPGLASAGFTYEYVDPNGLLLPEARRERGRLFGDGPGYRALVLDGQRDVPAAAAEAIERMARDGLRVVVVGEPPSRGASAKDPAGEDRAVQRAVAALLRLPTVTRAADEAGVPAALRRLGVEPAARPAQPSPLETVRRRAGDVEYWFVRNPSDRAVATELTLAARGVPSELDLWNGTERTLGEYRSGRDGVTVPVTLDPQESTVIAVRREGWREPLHATATDAEEVVSDGRRLLVRDTRAGVRQVRTSDGRTRRVALAPAGAPQTLGGWDLTVQEVGPRGATEKRLRLDALRSWSELPELRDASGTATYRTTFTAPAAWSGGRGGAYLDVGDVGGAMRVSVNGRRVTQQTIAGGRWALGDLLRPGPNDLTVELSTTLRNRLLGLAETEPEYAVVRLFGLPRKQYGLLGPVTLTPYAQAPVARR